MIAGVLGCVFVVFHLAGGWYFASQLHDEALDGEGRRNALEPDYDLEVFAADDVSLTLITGADAARRSGIWGVAWPGGYGLVHDITSSSESRVTRVFELVDGVAPKPGELVELHERAFPDMPAAILGDAPETVVVAGPLGEYESWFYPGARSTWVLLMHGNGLDRLDLAKLLPTFRAAGHPILIVTMRNDPGAPEDPNGMLRYGSSEWEDLEAAVQFATDAGAVDVVVAAPSMGGGVALTFLQRSDLVDAVSGLILDSPLVDFGRAVDARAADEKLPVLGLPIPGTLVATAKWFAAQRFDVDWDATGHLDETDRLTTPILVFHGTDDDDVPIATSRELAAARPDLVTLVEVEGASHLASWNLDRSLYESELTRFLEAVVD